MIEVEVHQQLQNLLRQSPDMAWPHQLTMARMVARGLRLGRNALIQVPPGRHHRLSYLLPALMWSGPTLLCVSPEIQQQILRDEIPWIQQTLDLHKPILACQQWPDPQFEGLVLMDPLDWLHHRLHHRDPFPAGIPVVMDGAEHLEGWARKVLTISLTAADWLTLQMAFPQHRPLIDQTHLQLSASLLRRPGHRLRLHQDDLDRLRRLCQKIGIHHLPHPWSQVLPHLDQGHHPKLQNPTTQNLLWWAEVSHDSGHVSLQISPINLAATLETLWGSQPFVLVGESLDVERDAAPYRQRLGIPDLTTLQFWASTQPQDPLDLVIPRLPIPNSPRFQPQVLPTLKHLICEQAGSVVILVSDRPLQGQIAAELAAEFGSRVQLNASYLRERGILIASWDYWLAHKDQLGIPRLLAMVTLPFPSTEDPEVAAHVEYLQQHHQDWFRTYLLPIAAATLQRAVAPLRQGSQDCLVAILDNRIITRSYGSHLLEALGPTTRLQLGSMVVSH